MVNASLNSFSRVQGICTGAKLRLTLEPSHLPLTIETEGTLAFDNGAPTFEGALALRRAAKAALRGGAPEEPWSVTARVKATCSGWLSPSHCV